jgi:large subunit ribosomal protein L25
LEINVMAQTELKASVRERGGKGAARQTRREGKVPGVIYGDGQPPQTITLDYNELWKQVLKGHFTSTVFELVVDGTKNRVIPRDVQVDPVKDQPIHVDFLRIGKDGLIRVEVPVRFVNDAMSPGLKRGGVLNIVRHDIQVTCPYDKIPAFFEVDLTGLEIGRSIHISAVKMPEGVRPTITNRDFTVATVAGHRVEEEAKPAEVAVAEGATAAAEGAPAAAAGDAKAAAGKDGAAAKAPAGKEAAKPAAKPAAKK